MSIQGVPKKHRHAPTENFPFVFEVNFLMKKLLMRDLSTINDASKRFDEAGSKE
jgi:hypothetical protein